MIDSSFALRGSGIFSIRPKRKKQLALFLEIGQAKIFLWLTRPHKSNVYENIYFVSKKHTHKQKNFH